MALLSDPLPVFSDKKMLLRPKPFLTSWDYRLHHPGPYGCAVIDEHPAGPDKPAKVDPVL